MKKFLALLLCYSFFISCDTSQNVTPTTKEKPLTFCVNTFIATGARGYGDILLMHM